MIKFKKLSNIFFSLMVVLPISIQAAHANQEPQASKPADKDIEVIGVVGEKPLAFFRLEMERAELDFYEAFNALVDNDKYRVICRKEARLGSRIKDRVCYPQYVLDRMAEETQEALALGNGFPSLKLIEIAVKDEREESLAYVEKVVMENPKLLEKLVNLNQKQNQYAMQKQSN